MKVGYAYKVTVGYSQTFAGQVAREISITLQDPSMERLESIAMEWVKKANDGMNEDAPNYKHDPWVKDITFVGEVYLEGGE